jgi:hypothetical protein
MKRPDLVSLASGVVVTALGAVVLLDASDTAEFPLGWVAVAVTAALGAVLLVSGMADGGSDRHD